MTSSSPSLAQSTPLGDPQSYSVDELYEFFDFFDRTVEDVYAYILHRTRAPEKTEEITIDVYFSLLQRSKFFWWKNTAQLSTILALADKAIETMPRWEEEAAGSAYFQELVRCVPRGGKEEKHIAEHMRILFHTLRILPLREQRMAVLHLFLHWPAAKTASIVGRSTESIQKEYGAISALLCAELQKEPAFAHKDVCEILNILFCPVLRETKKRALRLALLERCRTTRMSSMRFALPMGALLLLLTTLATSFVIPPLSVQGSVRSIAAAEVLLIDKEIAYRDAFLLAEADLRSIAAHVAGRNLADISVALVPKAAEQHVKQENEADRILRGLKAKSLQTAALLLKGQAD